MRAHRAWFVGCDVAKRLTPSVESLRATTPHRGATPGGERSSGCSRWVASGIILVMAIDAEAEQPGPGRDGDVSALGRLRVVLAEDDILLREGSGLPGVQPN
jgi:hypothetical protein